MGDEARLHQLFTNIIANALKHSPDNTAILIEAHGDGTNDTVVVNVVNFWSHIPESVRNDIFRRFVKRKSGPGTESGGTGLGLSIARWAAQLHGSTGQVIDDPREPGEHPHADPPACGPPLFPAGPVTS